MFYDPPPPLRVYSMWSGGIFLRNFLPYPPKYSRVKGGMFYAFDELPNLSHSSGLNFWSPMLVNDLDLPLLSFNRPGASVPGESESGLK